MLSRAARRRHALQYFQHAAEQVQLPWLCPALVQQPMQSQQKRHSRSIASRPIIPPHHHPPTASSTPSRHLASAATPAEDFDANDVYLPFSYGGNYNDGIFGAATSDASAPPRYSRLEPLDLSRILLIDSSIAEPPDRLTTNNQHGVEITGDTREIETTLDACLRVQRYDRAFALLKQLGIIARKGSYRLIDVYNRTLEAMVQDFLWNRNGKIVDRINNWVEVDMKNGGVEPDAWTYALKIKVALATLSGSKRDRTVRRYWEMARRTGFDGEVTSLRGILTDNDLGKLSEIGVLRYPPDFEPEDYESDVALELSADQNIAQKAPVQVLETVQKGMGLSTLRKTLSLFSDVKHLSEGDVVEGDTSGGMSYEERRQLRLERDAIDAAISRWKIEHEKLGKMGITGNFQYGKVGALLWQWHQLMTDKLVKEMTLVEEAEARRMKTSQDRLRCEYGPFLRLLKPDHIAAITNIAILQLMSRGGIRNPVKLARIVVEIGKALEVEVEAEKVRGLYGGKRKDQSPEESKSHKPAFHMHRSTHSSSLPYVTRLRWSPSIHARVGAILCELLFDVAKISVSKKDESTGKVIEVAQPVYRRQLVYQNGKRIGAVSIEDSMVALVVSQPAANLIAKHLPMVCPPMPWKSFYEGGFLESQQSFLRIKSHANAQRDYGEAASARGDFDQLYKGVDVLGRTAWKINRDVFGVMLEAWNSGEAVANLPPVNKVFPKLNKPPESAGAHARYAWFLAMTAIENEKGGLHSNRCFQNFQMEIAKAYLDETFYLPHNVDFRGRAYPIPPYLNQMGADNCRGLLLFAKGRPLGDDGLRWLKIQLSNVYGFDKASLKDRENFPMKHIEEIRDSVNHPLSGKKWWLTAEDPWQCLAACFELTQALDLPDPSKFVSHLPIHQDGSCNGLQHYAALGGDMVGAKQVNLEPGDKPADVYTGVAELVKAEIEKDAANGDGIAKQLEGRITRKIVKQTVMTNVYGVTFLGAIRQVRRQIDDHMPDIKESQRSGLSAAYIARKIFKALGAMFSGAHDIQYWLGDCANRISMSLSPAQMNQLVEKEHHDLKSPKKVPTASARTSRARKTQEAIDSAAFRSSVIWTTPLKLPVVQPYRVNKGKRIKTNLQEITLIEPSISDSVDKRKQLQAFPPNFIHSLDATHMILSALRADELGLTFSAVHDSFWTHAADINVLNSLLREAFIRMHSEDIISRLAAEFKMRYKGHLYLAQVRHSNRPGSLAMKIRHYRASLTFNRGSKDPEKRHFELMREIKRQRLLASEKDEEREEGRKMVTAASLFEEFGGEQDLHVVDSLGETAIGRIPDDTSESTVAKALESTPSTIDEDRMINDEVDLEGSLKPLVDAPHDLECSQTEAAEPSPQDEAATVQPRKRSPRHLWLWLPLTFRDVPAKGDFDVTRLRESQYFFS